MFPLGWREGPGRPRRDGLAALPPRCPTSEGMALYLFFRGIFPLSGIHRPEGEQKSPLSGESGLPGLSGYDNAGQASFCGRYLSTRSKQVSWLAAPRSPRLLTPPCGGTMAAAARSPFTVTGSLGISTRFPFTPAEAGHLVGFARLWLYSNLYAGTCQGMRICLFRRRLDKQKICVYNDTDK